MNTFKNNAEYLEHMFDVFEEARDVDDLETMSEVVEKLNIEGFTKTAKQLSDLFDIVDEVAEEVAISNKVERDQTMDSVQGRYAR